MIRALAVALLLLAGCDHTRERAQANPGALVPIWLCSADCINQRFPGYANLGGFCHFGAVSPEIWIATPYWRDAEARRLVHLTAHELLAHFAVGRDSREALMALDPGTGLWLRHAEATK